MIRLKTKEEIEIMKEGGRRLREVVNLLLSIIKVGVTTKKINDTAEELIYQYGGEPSFKKVKGYYWATCLPINEQIVHTPPSKRLIKDGDVLTLDIGFYYLGFHTDFATTLAVGKKNKEIDKFLRVGLETLDKAIKKIKIGDFLGQVSKTIEDEIKRAGFFVIKQLTGHGIGQNLHEDPFIPGFLDKEIEKTPKINPGLTLAIEVIYSMGSEEITYEASHGRSISTADKSLSACFEHTVAVTDRGVLLLT